MNSYRDDATKLRNAGYSYSMISQKLGIPKSTLSTWFSSHPFTPNNEVLKRIQYGPIISGAKRHAKRVQETTLLRKQGVIELGKMSKRDLWLFGLGLYLGEGAKSNEMVQFSNADPETIKIMIRWFVECCNVAKENIVLYMHLYPDNSEEDAGKFWREITGLSKENFRKTYIDKRTNKSKMKRRSLPYGTVHLRIKSNGDPEKGIRLFRKIRGWMDGALSEVG